MYIIVGLGNPEEKYTYTRHNAGFLALDLLAEKHSIEWRKRAHKAIIGEGIIGGKKVVLAKPTTYMNLSGQSVVDLLNWYKIDMASELIVVYDDIDLEVGSIRVRPKGSAGTHNGMRSIIYLTGSDEFTRIRIGIGAKKNGRSLTHHVLSTFDEDEKETVLKTLSDAGDAVEIILRTGVNDAMRAYNKKKKQDTPKGEPDSQEDAGGGAP